MNAAIKNLEKRKQRVLKMRTCYVRIVDKEQDYYESGIRKFDRVLDLIVKTLKLEWTKLYSHGKKIA